MNFYYLFRKINGFGLFHLNKYESRKSNPVTVSFDNVLNESIDNLQRHREPKESNIDSDKLASARKRLKESYKEAENGWISKSIHLVFGFSFLGTLDFC